MLASFQAHGLGIHCKPDELLTLAAGAGYPALEILVRDLLESGVSAASYRRRMEELGLVAGSMAFPFNWRGGEDSFARGLEQLPYWSEHAALLGVRTTSTWVLPALPLAGSEPGSPPLDRRGLAAWHQERLGQIADILSGSGISLGLETIGVTSFRPQGSEVFIDRVSLLETVLGPIEQIGRNVGFTLDAWHCLAAGESVPDAMAATRGRVVCVHVADAPLGWCGNTGELDDTRRGLPRPSDQSHSQALLNHLALTGYDGPVSTEPMAGCFELQGLSAQERARLSAHALDHVWPANVAGRPRPVSQTK